MPGSTKLRRAPYLKPFIILSILVLVIGFLLIGFFHVVLYSRLPDVSDISLEGAEKVDPRVVLSAVVGDMILKNNWRSFLGPKNIAFWTLGEKPDIAIQLPQIASLLVNADWRDRTVEIKITERAPFAVLCAEEKCKLADKDGVAYAPAPKAEGFLMLSGEAPESMLKSYGRLLPADEWENMMSILTHLKDLGFHIAKIKIGDGEAAEWSVRTNRGIILFFSRATAASEVIGIIQEIIKKVNLNEVNQIDFRIPGKIYYSATPAEG